MIRVMSTALPLVSLVSLETLGEPSTPPAAPTRDGKPAILDQSLDALKAWLAGRGQPPMRAKQIRRWVLAARAGSFDEMSDLPKALRLQLNESFTVFSMAVE